MTLPDRVRILWRDFDGRRALTCLHVDPATPDAQLAVFQALYSDLSEGVQVTLRREKVLDGPNPGIGLPGDYATHRDLAELILRVDEGARNNVVPVPMPLAALFIGGGQVDPENEALVALVEWLTTYGQDPDGHALLSYIGGNRSFIPKTPY